MINEIKLAFSENKRAIYISIAILFVCLILGYMLEPYLYAYLNPVVEELTKKVQSGAIKLTFTDIFLNNLRVIVQMFLMGIIFCFSALILAFHGFFVGYYIGTSDNLVQVLLYIIPHGIFEFSSCILACAASFVLFKYVFNLIKSFLKSDNDSMVGCIKEAFELNYEIFKQALILFCVSVILMAVAGFIEAYLTIPIAGYFMSILS